MVDMTCCAVLRADVRWAWTACGAVWLPNAKPELKLRVRFIERERVMRFRAHEHGMRILNHNAYVPVGRAALGAAITCWKCFVILIADECCQHGHCTFPCETSSHARRGSWPHNDTPHELYSLFIKSRDANAADCRVGGATPDFTPDTTEWISSTWATRARRCGRWTARSLSGWATHHPRCAGRPSWRTTHPVAEWTAQRP